MPSFYSVVQCVPDPFADERINIGVVVFGDGRIRSRFLHRWDRVERVAGKEIADFAESFARRFVQASAASQEGEAQQPLTGAAAGVRINEARLRRIIGESANSVQFTPIEPSTRDPDHLLEEIAGLALREEVERAPRLRNRRHARSLAVAVLRSALAERFDLLAAGDLVKERHRIAGRIVPVHIVDAAVTNGRVYDVAEAFSFEVADTEALEEEIYRALLGFEDIRAIDPQVARLDIVALRPRPELARRAEVERLLTDVAAACKRGGASLITDDEAEDWARDVAALVPVSALGHGRSVSADEPAALGSRRR